MSRVNHNKILISICAVLASLFFAAFAPVATAPLTHNTAYANPGTVSIDIDYIVDPSYGCQSNATGNWSAAGTWINCNSTTPQTADTVEIMAGHTVTLDASPTVASITIDATGILVASSYTITVSGNWANSGTFTANTSTVTLSGTAQAISGSNTFYKLTKTVAAADTITFTAGTTQTIAAGGNLTLYGAASNLLSVTSSDAAVFTLAFADATASYAIGYTSMSYVSASGQNILAINSTNVGNNLGFTFPAATSGTLRYWIATTSTTWNSTANWSTTSGGAGGSSVPTTTSDAIFDGNGNGACAIDAAASVKGFYLAGYSGTVTQNSAKTVTVGTDNYAQGSGTFTGSSGATANDAITLNGSFTLAGGTFTATAGTITAKGNWTYSGGTFTHNSGTLQLFNGSAQSLTLTGSHTLNNVTIGGNYHSDTLTIATGTTLTVSGTLNFAGSMADYPATINGGAIEAKGDIIQAVVAATGTTALNISGTGAQTFTGGGATANMLPLTINKSSGTLTLSGTIATIKNWTYTAGTIDAGTSTLQLFNASNKSLTLTGSHTLNNVTIGGNYQNNTLTIATGTTLTVNGTLNLAGSIAGGYPDTANGGAIEAKGDIIQAVVAATGTTTLNISGTGAQTWTSSGGQIPSSVVTINKSSGTVTLASALSLNTSGQDLAITSGTLDLAGFALTVNDQFTIGASGTLKLKGTAVQSTLETVTGGPDTLSAGSTVVYYGTNGPYTLKNWAYSNLQLSAATATTYTAPAAMTLTGNLTVDVNNTFDPGGFLITGSGTNVLTNAGTLLADNTTFGASYTSWETRTMSAGSTVNYSRAGDQTIDNTLTYVNLTTSGSGTKTLGGATTVSGNLTHTAGTIATSTYALNVAGSWAGGGGTVTGSGAGAVVLNGTSQTVSGSTTFNNLTFTAPQTVTFTAGTTQTLSGAFTCTGTAGNIITLASSAASVFNLSKASGTVSCDYISVSYSAAAGGATWNPGTHSTDGGNNTGWVFNTAPTLTSVATSPDPIKGGSTITIAPTGQGDADSNTLYYYCNETGAATSANTLCSQANGSYTTPYSTMTCTYAVTTGDATRTVYCRAYDGTDYSTERTTTYTVDTTAPAGGSVTYTNGYFTSTSVPITYTTGTDTGAGLSNATGKIQRASADLSAGTCGDFTAFADLVTEYDGSYTDTTVATAKCYKYQYLIQDAVANQATYTSANIAKVDANVPTTSDDFTHNDSWQNANQTITLTPTDTGGSGISWTKYCTDTSNTCVVSSGTAYTDPVVISTEGTSYFRYASQDAAGNTQTTVSKTVKIDKTNPITVASATTGGASYTFGQTASTAVTVTLTCADGAGSGCLITYYCADTANTCTPTTAYSTPVTISTEGASYIRYYSTDTVSNAETANSAAIQITTPAAAASGGGGSLLLIQEKQNTQNIAQQIQNIANEIASSFGGTPRNDEVAYPPIEESVPVEAPLPLQGWDIMGVRPIGGVALTPVESDVAFFAEKVPQFGQALTALGIDVNKISDVQKVVGSELYLPGLTQVVASPGDFEINKFAAVQGVPLADLSPEAKQKIPADIVFVRTGGELIDYKIGISVDAKGVAQQKIKVISGQPIQLVIKSDQPAKRVTGFISLKKSSASLREGQQPAEAISQSWAASLLQIASSLLAPRNDEKTGGEALLVNKFAYVELDTGIYTANITAPENEGEYEISTVIEYKDILLVPKEAKLTAIVNPEGYVYSQLPGGRLRIKGAAVSLYWLNTKTQKYELWQADKFLQKNPIVTDETGKYSFLVPKGTYKLNVNAINYEAYESAPFEMNEEIAVSRDIELKKKAGLLGLFSWQNFVVALLFIVIVLLCVIIIFFIKRSKKNKITDEKK